MFIIVFTNRSMIKQIANCRLVHPNRSSPLPRVSRIFRNRPLSLSLSKREIFVDGFANFHNEIAVDAVEPIFFFTRAYILICLSLSLFLPLSPPPPSPSVSRLNGPIPRSVNPYKPYNAGYYDNRLLLERIEIKIARIKLHPYPIVYTSFAFAPRRFFDSPLVTSLHQIFRQTFLSQGSLDIDGISIYKFVLNYPCTCYIRD